MVYQGQVKNGVIVLDEPGALPEGSRVTVEAGLTVSGKGMALSESLGELIGKAEGLPADFAKNHDHYLHGAPKK